MSNEKRRVGPVTKAVRAMLDAERITIISDLVTNASDLMLRSMDRTCAGDDVGSAEATVAALDLLHTINVRLEAFLTGTSSSVPRSIADGSTLH